MAGSDAGFATGALVQIDFEGVLLACAWCLRRKQVAIITGLLRPVGSLVTLGKLLDRSQALLLVQQRVDERGLFSNSI